MDKTAELEARIEALENNLKIANSLSFWTVNAFCMLLLDSKSVTFSQIKNAFQLIDIFLDGTKGKGYAQFWNTLGASEDLYGDSAGVSPVLGLGNLIFHHLSEDQWNQNHSYPQNFDEMKNSVRSLIEAYSKELDNL